VWFSGSVRTEWLTDHAPQCSSDSASQRRTLDRADSFPVHLLARSVRKTTGLLLWKLLSIPLVGHLSKHVFYFLIERLIASVRTSNLLH